MLAATIDTGTTNTRVRIWHAGGLLATAERPTGVRDVAIGGNRQVLVDAVADAYRAALGQAGLADADLSLCVATGMLSSGVGLLEIPHLVAPVGLQDLAAGMVAHRLPSISEHPIWFVPGVRNAFEPQDAEHYRQIDFMRGEEVEAFALLDLAGHRGPAVLVLPGSHNKFVFVDAQARIVACHTTLSGELVAALTQHTILAASLHGQYLERLDELWLRKGAGHTAELGLCSAAFAVRGLQMFGGATPQQCANFLAGAVFASDFQALAATPSTGDEDAPIFVAGSEPTAAALRLLIADSPRYAHRLARFRPDPAENLAGRGALLVASQRQPIQ